MSLELDYQEIGNISDVKGGKRLPKGHNLFSIPNNHPYIKVKDMANDKLLKLTRDFEYIENKTYDEISQYIVKKDDLIISIVGTIGLTNIIDSSLDNANLTENCAKITNLKKGYNIEYIYYFFNSKIGQDLVQEATVGAVQKKLPIKNIRSLNIPFPNLDVQNKIVKILSYIDKKIEINKNINKNLHNLGYSIFLNKIVYFVNDVNNLEITEIPNNWIISNLYDIANFQNGLAMQKFRQNEKEDYFHVLKIKELRNGRFDDSSEFCSRNIKKECIVEDGDVIFSWSGSLLLDLWTGGECGLNQHLFKVTSDKFDKWFYYYWIKFYLNKFSRIAKDKATTMGHIKLNDLKESEVIIPDENTYNKLNEILNPIFKELINNSLEIKKLSKLRDTLLPKLMSGEIDVSKINSELHNNYQTITSIIIHNHFKLFIRSDSMKTKIISKIQNQMKPYLNQGQYLKLTRSLLDSLQDIDIIDKSNDLSDIDNFKLLNLFLSAKQVEGCSNKTIQYYESTIEKMLIKIKKHVYNINTDDLRSYLFNHKNEKHSSKTTIDNIRRIFSSFFSWLEDEDYIIKNPVRRIHRVKTGRVVKEVLTDENLEVLRDNCDEIRDLAMVELLISTGIRVGELVRLNIEDINFYERECVVFGKGESERIVYFDARTKIHLMEYLHSRVDENPALFVSLNNPHTRLGISGVETRLRELGEKCKINNVHPHKFRRTMATNAIDKGMPIEQVQKLLGHVQIDTTMQYAMVNQSNVKLAHRKFIG